MKISELNIGDRFRVTAPNASNDIWRLLDKPPTSAFLQIYNAYNETHQSTGGWLGDREVELVSNSSLYEKDMEVVKVDKENNIVLLYNDDSSCKWTLMWEYEESDHPMDQCGDRYRVKIERIDERP